MNLRKTRLWTCECRFSLSEGPSFESFLVWVLVPILTYSGSWETDLPTALPVLCVHTPHCGLSSSSLDLPTALPVLCVHTPHCGLSGSSLTLPCSWETDLPTALPVLCVHTPHSGLSGSSLGSSHRPPRVVCAHPTPWPLWLLTHTGTLATRAPLTPDVLQEHFLLRILVFAVTALFPSYLPTDLPLLELNQHCRSPGCPPLFLPL